MATEEDVELIEENKISSSESGNGTGLVLYCYHHCFHSQKVLMALNEKNIPFKIELVDITRDEQYESWFLKINPKGTLPVLKDGIKYIPNSKRIMGYLEDNFSNGEYTRLIPIDQGHDVRQRVISFHDKVCEISPYIVTMGTIVNNRWCNNLKYPYSLYCVRRLLKASFFSSCKTLRRYASKSTEFKEVLLQKADALEKINSLVTVPENYLKIIETIEDLMNEVEKELFHRGEEKADWWLFTDRFTIADISFTLLLDRLSRLGMELNFWKGGMRPHVEMYYHRAQERESYKKIIPTLSTDLSFFMKTRGSLIVGISLLTVATVVVGSFLRFRK
ncbi:hypothetical protein RUM43_014672 [Polyplax serrata]|uniref:GST N-terminal domain-containing protein n=1 Tax=Polyplax serrata TaxID=468196 RepID=A0AAN8P127_POLSC